MAKGVLSAVRLPLFLVALLYSSVGYSAQCDPLVDEEGAVGQSQSFEHQFDSGARWQMCWHIDDYAGLTLSQIAYGAPQEPLRTVLKTGALAQILFKYDADTTATQVLSQKGLGANNHVPASTFGCTDGDVHSLGNVRICVKLRNKNSLTSLRRSQSIRRHELSLHALSISGAQRFEQVWRFSEDGEITPSVRLGGELDRFTHHPAYGSPISSKDVLAANASLLFTWRLDFNIAGTTNNDLVEQFEFVPHADNSVKRSINTQVLNVESFHSVNRTQFRGWLIKDADEYAGASGTTRIGYYLDPQSSGFDFVNQQHHWANYSLAVSRSRDCEQLASGNDSHVNDCASNLDEYVNSESLQNEDIVVWFSLAKPLIPKSEDYPAISTREAYFKLIPFDWSASTPFSELGK